MLVQQSIHQILNVPGIYYVSGTVIYNISPQYKQMSRWNSLLSEYIWSSIRELARYLMFL